MAETAPPNGSSEQWGQQRPVTLGANGTIQTPHGEMKPNTGSSKPDFEAAAGETEPIAAWQKRNNIDTSHQIKLVKLAHMRYQHPDLEKITKFLKDFGMHVNKTSEDGSQMWWRGYGPDQYVYYAQKGAERKFLGGTYEVESMADLEKAAKLEGASKVEELTEAPGGGHMVTLHDPEGFPVNLMYGQTPAPKGDYPPKVITNFETEKPRVRKFNRFTPGPAAVHKLGHYGLCVLDFNKQLEWYIHNFNLVPSDFLYVPTEDGSKDGRGKPTKDVATFLHLDRGEDPVDHHTFFMTQNPSRHVHHCSFEVHDYDTQHLGHQWLAKEGYISVWGIGRHILGSQIFDYCEYFFLPALFLAMFADKITSGWDTTGNMVEHYADGDLVNKDTPIGWGFAGDEGLAVWGPEVPKWFLE